MTAAALRTATPADGPVASARRHPVAVAVVLGLLALLVFTLATSSSRDTTALSIDNPTGPGTRAVAQILRSQGVEVRQVERLAAVRVADPAEATLVVAGAGALTDGQLESLANYPADTVLLDPSPALLEALGVAADTGFSLADGTAPAGCEDGDARAAERVTVGGWGLRADAREVTACFTTPDGISTFVRATDGDRTITAIAPADLLTNARLDEHGNAALALRALGRHPEAVWYLPALFDASVLPGAGGGAGEVETPIDLLPPGTGSALYAAALAVLIAAVWRGRRFGALVRERLPVVVRSSEATRGRARLYRRVRATGRAGAALRAATALRMGARLGVPRSADRGSLVDAVARASGRDAAAVDHLLYGPAPASDAALHALVQDLDSLESEVHRP